MGDIEKVRRLYREAREVLEERRPSADISDDPGISIIAVGSAEHMRAREEAPASQRVMRLVMEALEESCATAYMKGMLLDIVRVNLRFGLLTDRALGAVFDSLDGAVDGCRWFGEPAEVGEDERQFLEGFLKEPMDVLVQLVGFMLDNHAPGSIPPFLILRSAAEILHGLPAGDVKPWLEKNNLYNLYHESKGKVEAAAAWAPQWQEKFGENEEVRAFGEACEALKTLTI